MSEQEKNQPAPTEAIPQILIFFEDGVPMIKWQGLHNELEVITLLQLTIDSLTAKITRSARIIKPGMSMSPSLIKN